jgi:predicted nucleic acid-binding protein
MNFLDTSVLVAGAQPSHIHYEPSRKLLDQANRSNSACSLHSLAETYSILSGLPKPARFPPEAALRIVEQARQRLQVISLTEKEYAATIVALASEGLSGGIVYDALLVQCARKANAKRIYSWNARHFKLVAPDLADRIFVP